MRQEAPQAKGGAAIGIVSGMLLLAVGIYLLIVHRAAIGWALIAAALLFLPFVWKPLQRALPLRELGVIRWLVVSGVVITAALPFIKGDSAMIADLTRGEGGPPPDLSALNDAADPSKGRYHAILFAAEQYKEWPDLQYPIDDAEELKRILMTDYLFNEEDILLVKDPSRGSIISTLNDYTKPGRLNENDNVLIFYAGHGKQQTITAEGFWVPVDGAKDDPSNYVSAPDVLNKVQGMKARHVLLVVDACFSGSIFELGDTHRGDGDAAKYYTSRSRKAMTSGALEEVNDNSLFMKTLLQNLAGNQEPYLLASTLFNATKDTLGHTKGFSQMPQFNRLQSSADEGGDFVFVKRR